MKKILTGLGIIYILISYTNCLFFGVAATAAAGAVIVEERSVGNVLDDNIDVNAIRIDLSKKKEVYKDVSVVVFEGRVLVTGRVDNEEDYKNVEKLIWSFPRVIEVINEIDVREDPQKANLNETMQDSWISAKIRSKLLFNKKTKSLNYKIVVNNNIIYLIGVAKNQEEIDSILGTVSSVRGVDKVKSFIILKDDKRRSKKIT